MRARRKVLIVGMREQMDEEAGEKVKVGMEEATGYEVVLVTGCSGLYVVECHQ